MAEDDCDLEELTAFLETSDDEAAAENEVTAGNQDKKDDCSMEEIQAFLEESDDDDEDDDNDNKDQKEDNGTTDQKMEEPKAARANIEDAHADQLDDFDAEDLEQMDQLMLQPQPAGIDSRPDKTCPRSSEDICNSNSSNTSDIPRDKAELNQDEEVAAETAARETMATNDSEESNDALDPAEAIKAEMAAMAERMKQLEKMLAKSSPKPASSKASPGTSSSKTPTKPSMSKASTKSSSSEKRKQRSDHKGDTSNNDGDCKHINSSSSVALTKALSVAKSSRSDVSTMNKSKPSDDKLKTKDKSKKDSHHHHHHSKGQQKISPKSKCDTKEKAPEKSLKGITGTKECSSDRKRNLFEDTKPKITLTEKCPFFSDEESQAGSKSTGSYKKAEPVVDSKSVFGESDDSDWDDLGGEEKSQLSKEGREIKKLMVSGERKREAHTPSYDPALIRKPDLKRWTDANTAPRRPKGNNMPESTKPAVDPLTGTVSGKYKVKDEFMPKATSLRTEDERESVTDPFCGIRIINPRISMSEFKRKMDGRQMVKVSRLLSKYGSADLQKDNWVTMGVVVHKTEPRQSAAGKTYCIWKLSDLQCCEQTVTFFLFGNVYKEHWKNSLGIVIGLLNPSIMDKAEKTQSEVAITINHPQQLLLMGVSKDLDRCRSTTKSGNPCSSFVNKLQGDYCTYHVQAAYRKSSSRRTELQATTGLTPKNFQQKRAIASKNNGSFYFGGSTYSTTKPPTKSPKDRMTLKKLQSYDAGNSGAGKITTMSLHELQPEDELRLQKLEEKDKNLLSLLSVPSVGSMNFVKHLVKKDATATLKQKEEEGEVIVAKSAKDLLKAHTQEIQQKRRERQQQTALLAAVPTIGKGLSSGQEISLDAPLKKTKVSASAELAKQLAIAKVKAKGGISKEDPNAVRKKLTSPEARDNIRKRVADDSVADNVEDELSYPEESREPPRKKSKLLGDLDLNSPEVQKLLKKKSKHTGALAEAEAEHEERYFGALEKRERMEDKMASTMEVPVTLVFCAQCKYKSMSAHERCKTENHRLSRMKGVKRFFRCKQCKKKTDCFDKFPTQPCRECGTMNFERCSMLNERKGPKLGSEQLCLRGNEQKFLGGLQGTSYLGIP